MQTQIDNMARNKASDMLKGKPYSISFMWDGSHSQSGNVNYTRKLEKHLSSHTLYIEEHKHSLFVNKLSDSYTVKIY
jgi:hypothetical protein